MSAPVGATVTITYDATDATPVAEGDFLRTRADRWYRVLEARRVRSTKADYRWRLALLVLETGKIPAGPPDARVFPLVFYPRDRKR